MSDRLTIDDVRAFALSLPEASEADHHGMPSFRVRNKIYATVPDDAHIRVMVSEDEIRAAAAHDPDACEEFCWGKRLSCLLVTIARVDRDRLEGLIEDAYLRKAPKALIDQLPKPESHQ